MNYQHQIYNNQNNIISNVANNFDEFINDEYTYLEILNNNNEKNNNLNNLNPLNEYIYYYNEPIKLGQIPLSTKILYFLDDFNFQIRVGDIPPFVSEIHFGKSFNQPLQINALPKNLLRLKFSLSYKQNLIPGINIPINIISVKFGELFDFEIGSEASSILI